MSNTSLSTLVALAVSTGLLIATLSGGAVTYASFTDSGGVDVTFTTGNITENATSETESTRDGNETTQNDSESTDDGTSQNTTAYLAERSPEPGTDTHTPRTERRTDLRSRLAE